LAGANRSARAAIGKNPIPNHGAPSLNTAQE
jgi:hypothetical protein